MKRDELKGILLDRALYKELRDKALVSGARGMPPVVTEGNVEAALEAIAVDPNLEKLIRSQGRPALVVRKDSFVDADADIWRQRLSTSRSLVERALRSVGRVELQDSDSAEWVGTAWVIAPGVAVTNRHVAREFARRGDGGKGFFRKNLSMKEIKARVDFKEEFQEPDDLEIRVVDVLYISDDLEGEPDIAFLKLDDGRPQPPPLGLLTDPVSSERQIAVIGYPDFDPREDDRATMSRVFQDVYAVKRLSPGMVMTFQPGPVFNHDCSTLGGNSGSVVLDLLTGAAVGLHFAGDSRKANYAVKAAVLKEQLDKLGAPTVTVPKGPESTTITTLPVERRAASEYADRKGYAADFLGGQLLVPMLTVPATPVPGAPVPAVLAVPGTPDNALRYAHFSVVMHATRRMCLFTAVNIDGKQSRLVRRSRDKWILDMRIAEEAQLGPSAYDRNDLDRGHMVRRLDPAWGELALKANDDTFHYTNACPQHADLNQRTWVELEDYILDNADANDLKISVFTGPVLSEDDPPYRDYRVPRAFWKVVAMVRPDGRPSATAYLQNQDALIEDLEFVFGRFRTYQIPVAQVSRLTGLDLGKLAEHDPLTREEGPPRPHLLNKLGDIKL